MEDVMVDLETLGTRPGSVILSIGAVFFDPKAEGEGLGHEFHIIIDVASSCVAGLNGSASTIKWWRDQSPEARATYDKAFSGYGIDLSAALAQFKAWLSGHADLGKVKIWGNGAAFDNALLLEAYLRAGLPRPWGHRGDRCFRTLKNLARSIPEPRFIGVPHFALDDAKHQARWAVDILRQLTVTSPTPEGDRGPATTVAHVPIRNTAEEAIRDAVLTGTGMHRITEEEARAKEAQHLAAAADAGRIPRPSDRVWPCCTTCGQPMAGNAFGLYCPNGHQA